MCRHSTACLTKIKRRIILTPPPVEPEQDAKRLGTHLVKAMDGKLFTLFISSILISEIRRRMDGFNGQWTLNSIRTSLDKITFSKVKVEHLKKAKELEGLVSRSQREYLAKLLDCPQDEAADKLFAIRIP